MDNGRVQAADKDGAFVDYLIFRIQVETDEVFLRQKTHIFHQQIRCILRKADHMPLFVHKLMNAPAEFESRQYLNGFRAADARDA